MKEEEATVDDVQEEEDDEDAFSTSPGPLPLIAGCKFFLKSVNETKGGAFGITLWLRISTLSNFVTSSDFEEQKRLITD